MHAMYYILNCMYITVRKSNFVSKEINNSCKQFGGGVGWGNGREGGDRSVWMKTLILILSLVNKQVCVRACVCVCTRARARA